MSLRASLVALAAVVLGAAPGYSQCTTETEQGRRLVREVATRYGSESGPPDRLVDDAQVQLLTNPSDSGVCERLFAGLTSRFRNPEIPPADRHWTFYQVGSLYYVVVTRISPPVQHTNEGVRLRLGWTPILIFNSNFEHITTVGR